MPDPVFDPARLTARVVMKLREHVPPAGQGGGEYARRVGVAFRRAEAALGFELRIVPQFAHASPDQIVERRVTTRWTARRYFRRRVRDEQARLERLGVRLPDGWAPPADVPAPGQPGGRRVPADDLERVMRELGADAPVGPLKPYEAPDLRTWLRVLVPEGRDARRVREALAAAFGPDDLEHLYVEPPPAPPPGYAGRDLLVGQQGHLDAAPLGVDARWAWSQTGGEGAGARWADVEHNWNLGHEDLPAIAWGGGLGVGQHADHGTAVVGVVAAVHDNCRGGAGIAPAASGAVFSPLRVVSDANGSSFEFVLADAIYQASATLRAGDVLLIEAQVSPPDGAGAPKYLPAEVEPSVFDAIREATARGVVVVEAAGNGGARIDDWKHPDTGATPFAAAPSAGASDIANLYVSDSGAILVGAGTSGLPRGGEPGGVHRRFGADRPEVDGSNHGRRIDCYAWGEDVTTCGPGAHGYTSTFSGTSSAAAIIAGVVAVINGAHRARGKAPLEAYEMRALLRDGPGTSCADPDVDLINRMPDLRGILRDSLGLAPKLSIRDGRKGAPFASPDVWIGRKGGGDGRPLRAVAGEALEVYVRVASDADVESVRVRVWAVPVHEAPVFARWRLVASTLVADARLGPDEPLVVGPLPWDADDQPEAGHCALVAAAWNAAEDAPDFSRVRCFRDFARHVSEEPAVAARLVTFARAGSPVQGVEPAGPRFAKLRFWAVGDPAREEQMAIHLDEAFDGRAWLEVPDDVPAELLAGLDVEQAPPEDLAVAGRLVRVPDECPRGLLAGRFPAGWRAALHLVVEADRAADPRLAVEQRLRGGERDVVVGRLAWNLDDAN